MMIRINIKLLIVFFIIVFSCWNILSSEYVNILKEDITPFKSLEDIDFLLNQIGDERLVLLGESTHGTSEYYKMRAEISKRLIADKGFSFIGVEGDWASIYRLNLYIHGLSNDESAESIMKSFNRWPEWMWSNKETAVLIEWLKEYNSDKEIEDMAGFYGIDVYGQWEAKDNLIEYIKENMPKQYEKIKGKAQCFTSQGRDEQRYVRAVLSGQISCDEKLSRIVEILEENKAELKKKCSRKYMNALQNAIVLNNAEEFYRLSARRGPASWNSRAGHFYNTALRLLDFYGDNSKGVIWAHNTHIGDSRATSMAERNMVNIGKLSRRGLGPDNVFIIGFSTNKGNVLAGRTWGAPMENMTIPEGIPGSLENKLSGIEYDKFYIVFSKDYPDDHSIMRPIGHRAIGVVYNPRQEAGNYVPTVVPERYDMLIFIRETNALEIVR